MNFCRILCSNGSSNLQISGMVQMKYVNLLLKQPNNGAYADYG